MSGMERWIERGYPLPILLPSLLSKANYFLPEVIKC